MLISIFGVHGYMESKQEEAAPRKADINRFIALVRKYQNITELTDENWNAFAAEIQNLGLDEMIGIWQSYVK